MLLIDLENMNKDIDLYDFSGFEYVCGYMARNNPLVDKKFNFDVEIAQSTRKDAADVLITLRVSKICDVYSKIFILTRDHFASTIQDIVRNVVHVSSFTELTGLKSS